MHLFKRIVNKSEIGSKLGLSPQAEAWSIPNSPVPYHRPSTKYDRLNDDDSDNIQLFARPDARPSSFSTPNAYPIPASSSSFFFDSIDDAGCFDLWNSLPYELKFEVLKHVSLKDVAALSVSCRLINQLTNENALWKHWAFVHLGLSNDVVIEFGSQIQSWRNYVKFQTSFYKKGFLQSQKPASVINKPQPRFAQTACVIGNKIYYVGGQMADKRSDEILTYTTTTSEFEKVTPSNYDPKKATELMPSKEQVAADCKNFKGVDGKVPNFARHQSVPINGKIYVFGGYDYTFFYNLAVFDPVSRAWTYPEVFGDVPAPRSNHSSCVVGNKFYIFGGSVGDNVDKYSVTNDFYCLDTVTMHCTRLSTDPASEEPCKKNSSIEPSGRVGHVMASVGDHIYLFGGGVWGKVSGWTQQYNDLYIYDTKTNQWEAVALKNEEKPGVCTYPYIFTAGLNVVIFGGASMTGSTVTNKLYGWDVLARKWREMTFEGEDISARSIGTASFVGDEIVLWGGYCGGLLSADNDLFVLKFKM
jgi:N-acetylneuraminic acid mutarotase